MWECHIPADVVELHPAWPAALSSPILVQHDSTTISTLSLLPPEYQSLDAMMDFDHDHDDLTMMTIMMTTKMIMMIVEQVKPPAIETVHNPTQCQRAEC